MAARKRSAPLRIDAILDELRSGNSAACNRGLEQLKILQEDGLTSPERQQVFRAAAETWPERTDGIDLSFELVHAALSKRPGDLFSLALDYYPRLSSGAKRETLQCLTAGGDLVSARRYLDFVARYVPTDEFGRLDLSQFMQSEKALQFLIPELLRLPLNDGHRYELYIFLVDAAAHGFLNAADLAPETTRLVAAYERSRQQQRAFEEPQGWAWIRDDDYSQPRCICLLLLDLMRLLPWEIVGPLLNEALTSRDPALQHYAAISLLEQGKPVPQVALEAIAASGEMRKRLYLELENRELLSLFPAQFATPEALAESMMIDWLIFPTELNSPPDEIELMSTRDIPIDYDDDEEDLSETAGLTPNDATFERFFLFRFRCHPPHWAADKGWMAGMAGPLEIDPVLSAHGGHGTFSQFEAWDSKSPWEHFEQLLSILDRHFGPASDDADEDNGDAEEGDNLLD